MTAGVYAIRNRANNRVYVGSSFNIELRWKRHLDSLQHGNGMKTLQADWNFYGPDSFRLDMLEVGARDNATLQEAEQRWLDELHAQDPDVLYNARLTAQREGQAVQHAVAASVVTINQSLPADLHERLKRLAAQDDRSMANLIIRVLREWADAKESKQL